MVYVHNIDPILIEYGMFQVRWYGTLWALGIIFVWILFKKLLKEYKIKKDHSLLEEHQQLDFLTYVVLGTVLGARIFYVLFYNFFYYLENPLKTFAIWEGGLSFHGGLIGGVIVGYYYCKKHDKDFWAIADLIAVPLGIALFLGRIGNFINSELIGRRVSETFSLAVDFGDGPRHPSQLYEAAKNLVIFGYLYWRKNKYYHKGVLFIQFIMLYSVFRFIIEYFRKPDDQIGYLAFGLTMGQYLNIFLFIVALWFYIKLDKIEIYYK